MLAREGWNLGSGSTTRSLRKCAHSTLNSFPMSFIFARNSKHMPTVPPCLVHHRITPSLTVTLKPSTQLPRALLFQQVQSAQVSQERHVSVLRAPVVRGASSRCGKSLQYERHIRRPIPYVESARSSSHGFFPLSTSSTHEPGRNLLQRSTLPAGCEL